MTTEYVIQIKEFCLCDKDVHFALFYFKYFKNSKSILNKLYKS